MSYSQYFDALLNKALEHQLFLQRESEELKKHELETKNIKLKAVTELLEYLRPFDNLPLINNSFMTVDSSELSSYYITLKNNFQGHLSELVKIYISCGKDQIVKYHYTSKFTTGGATYTTLDHMFNIMTSELYNLVSVRKNV